MLKGDGVMEGGEGMVDSFVLSFQAWRIRDYMSEVRPSRGGKLNRMWKRKREAR